MLDNESRVAIQEGTSISTQRSISQGHVIDQKGPSACETKRFTVRVLKIFTKHLDAWHCLSGKSCWLNRVHIYFARCHDRVGRRVICVIPEASPNVDIRTIGRVGQCG